MEKKILIGVIGPMSGPDEKWGRNSLAGINCAITLENRRSDKNRYEIVVKDDKNDVELAKKSLDELVNVMQVSAVLLLSKSEVALGLREVVDQYGVPVLALVSTHPDVTKNNKYFSQLLFDDASQATVAAMYLRDELLVGRVGVVIDSKNDHSAYLANKFSNIFDSVGGVSIDIPYFKNRNLLRSRLKGLHANEISHIYLPVNDDFFMRTVSILQELDYSPTLVGSDGLQANLLLNYPDQLESLEGMIATDPYSTDAPLTEYGAAISKLFQTTFDIRGTALAALGAEGMSMLVSAVDSCFQEVTPSCINRSLQSTVDFMGYQDRLTIRKDGTAERPIYINRVDGHKLVRIVKVY